MDNKFIKNRFLAFDNFMYRFTNCIIKKQHTFLFYKKNFEEKATKIICIIMPIIIWRTFIIIYKSIKFSDFLISIYLIIGLSLIVLSIYYYWGVLQFLYPEVRKNTPKFYRNKGKSEQNFKNGDIISISDNVNKNPEEESIEEKFKLFFNESKYEEFKKIAIDLDIINEKMKWSYKRKELLYFVLLFYKLDEKQYLKKPINREKFCEASKAYLEIKIDKSLFSKYNPKKDNLLHEHIEYYNNEYSVFI